jgi:hypothetical protein
VEVLQASQLELEAERLESPLELLVQLARLEQEELRLAPQKACDVFCDALVLGLAPLPGHSLSPQPMQELEIDQSTEASLVPSYPELQKLPLLEMR